MYSCLQRRLLRRQTISDFRATDWNDALVIEIDRLRCGQAHERILGTGYRLLRRAIEAGPDLILLLEDDLRFNRHLRSNLERWHPLAGIGRRDFFFGSLFNPRVRERECHRDRAYIVAEPRSVFGSQALVLSWASARYMIEHWDAVDGPLDFKLSRLAAQVGPIYFHWPSLVQHVGYSSTWGGPFFRAFDFQPDWTA
jgi:hypothetical protein